MLFLVSTNELFSRKANVARKCVLLCLRIGKIHQHFNSFSNIGAMKISKLFSSKLLLYFLFLLTTIIKQAECQVGLVYGPFVKDGDNPDFTKSYSKEDVKVMLTILADNNYHHITTYQVGVPSEPYLVNSTRERCSSEAHAALAAAEINRERDNLTLSLFLGLLSISPSQVRINSEIEVGFNIVAASNQIYEGTVTSIISPGLNGFEELFDMKDKITNVSSRTRKAGLKFGARIWDCIEKIPTRDKDDIEVKEMMELFDFIICRRLPNFNTFQKGPETEQKIVTRDIYNVEDTLHNEMGLNIEVILETGWPGGNNLNGQNTIEDMLHFWDLIKNWAESEKRMVFMYEAFNSPWRDSNREILWGGNYGLWMHSGSEDNSRTAYIKKTTLIGRQNKDEVIMGRNQIIFVITLGTILVILIGLMVMMMVLHKRVQNLKNEKLSEAEIQEFLDGSVSNGVDNKLDEFAWARLPYNRKFELSKESFRVENVILGKGEYGCVYRGRIEGSRNYVAFKKTTLSSEIFVLRGLLSEIKILGYLGKHENVISLCGAYTADLAQGIVYVATELCSNGSLDEYLQANSSTTSDLQLIRWAYEIPVAMEYISSQNIVHRDLATRNILLTDNLTAKVTDFGLSRRLYEHMDKIKQTTPERFPWKWMAIESLRKLEFSTKSDVWSYGITLWEIFSLGESPYEGQCFDENFVTRLEIGLRMDSPARMPSEIAEIMSSSWHGDPRQRPNFSEIKTQLLPLFKRVLPTDAEVKACLASHESLQDSPIKTLQLNNYLRVGYIDVECIIDKERFN